MKVSKTNDFKRLASLVKRQLNVDYNRKSVTLLEKFIEDIRHDHSREEAKKISTSIGAFLGECIIHNFGGAWHKDDEGRWWIRFNDKNSVNPFSKVLKQFKNGLEDSVAKFYATIPLVFSHCILIGDTRIDDAPRPHFFYRHIPWLQKPMYYWRKFYWLRIRKASTEKWKSFDKNVLYHCTMCGKFIGKARFAFFDGLERAHCSPECVNKSRFHWTWYYDKEGIDY